MFEHHHCNDIRHATRLDAPVGPLFAFYMRAAHNRIVGSVMVGEGDVCSLVPLMTSDLWVSPAREDRIHAEERAKYWFRGRV